MVVLPTPACLPCVHGCNSDGVCNDEPYTEDGLPIVSYEYDECSLHEVGGTCDDGAYEWTCGRDWCVDTFEVYWPTRSG